MLQRERSSRLAAGLAAALLGALAACSRGGGGELGPAVRLNEAEGGAASFSWPYYTSIVASGEHVAAAFMTRHARQHRDVVVRRSTDAGATWAAPVVLNEPDYTPTVSVAPKLALMPAGGLLAVWQSRRNEAGQKFVLARRATDFGGAWGPAAVLNSVPQAFAPALASRDDGTVIVAFSDERNIARDIFVNRTKDGGASWLAKDVGLDVQARTESIAPAVALARDGQAWVIWEEKARDSGRLLAAHSRDEGATWGPPRRVDPEGQPASPLWPDVVESAGRVTAVWAAGVVGETRKSWLWVASSADGGETWGAPQLFYEGPAQAVFHVVARGSHVYLAWNGGSEAGVGIYWNASDDGGATWRLPLDRPLRLDDSGASGRAANRPRIAVAGDGIVAVTWQEDDKRVALKVSTDAGKSWPREAMTIATADKDRVRFPQVAVTEKLAYVLWEEWASMEGERKTLADVEKPTPIDVYVRRVNLPR